MMHDREKVIRKLQDALENAEEDGNIYAEIRRYVVFDAITLLKAQDAEEVKGSTNMYTGLPITHCPKCGVSIDRYLYGRQHEGQINYCPYCGKAVKWK